MRFLKHRRAQGQHVRMIVAGPPDDRQHLATVCIADQRGGAVRPQVRAHVVNHLARSFFPVTLANIDAFR